MEQLRIGLLGAASIAPNAVIRPARHVPGVAVTAVAARDAARAQQYATRHGIPIVRDSYAALLDDPEVDAVYIGLPNGLHAEWTLRAMAAGKHVLCEKPFTSNAAQAVEVDFAGGKGPVVMEAMHYVYHPLADRLREIVAEELAPVREIEVTLSIPLPRFSDIRYNYDLAGGAMMDVGVYTVHVARLLAGEEPRVTSAEARTIGKDPRIDRAMTVRLAYPSGATGLLRASMWSRSLLAITARVTGERGAMKVTNYLAPQIFHRVRVKTARGHRTETVRGEATYTAQLRAFEAAIRDGGEVRTPARDAVRTMTVIDDAYRAAGLPTR